MTKKTCIRCTTIKPLESFSRDKRRSDGLSPYCRPCRSEVRKNENRNPELARQARRRHYLANREQYLTQNKSPERLALHRDYHREKQATDSSYREQAKQRAKRAYSANPERHRQQTREWRKKNAEKHKRAQLALHLQKSYGITLEMYEAMVEAQNGVCMICLRPPSGQHKRLFVDHCHKTGKIRSLLCNTCNAGIGALRDDVEILSRAIDYLKLHAD